MNERGDSFACPTCAGAADKCPPDIDDLDRDELLLELRIILELERGEDPLKHLRKREAARKAEQWRTVSRVPLSLAKRAHGVTWRLDLVGGRLTLYLVHGDGPHLLMRQMDYSGPREAAEHFGDAWIVLDKRKAEQVLRDAGEEAEQW